jgi:hypothetical protein
MMTDVAALRARLKHYVLAQKPCPQGSITGELLHLSAEN